MSEEKQWKEIKPDLELYWPAQDETLEEDDSIEGKYVEVRRGVGSKGESSLYVLETEDGDLVGAWGSYKLDEKMRDIPLDSNIKIVYKGKKSIGSGKDMKDYRVFGVPSTMKGEVPREEEQTFEHDVKDVARDPNGNPVKEVDADDIP